MITITPHEKAEWARFAQAAYANDRNATGTRFSVAASVPTGYYMTCPQYDALMHDYRQWLVFDNYPADDMPLRERIARDWTLAETECGL